MSHGANGNTDEDHFYLDQVLNKLYDFGDGTSKKKKKRKRCVEEEEETVASTVCRDSEDVRHESHQESTKTQNTTAEQTGPSNQRLAQVEMVTFQDPSKKAKTKEAPGPDIKPSPQIKKKKKEENKDRPEELLFEKARVEVHRFGITGYKKEQQRSFEQDRAIMLGARPPKKEYVNYKVLQQRIKDKKQEVQSDGREKKKKRRPQSRDKKRKAPSGSGTLGQVGRFKNGVLLLSSKELEKIKGSRGGK